jgi:NSS family neurotransmitter:Na+ symporter
MNELRDRWRSRATFVVAAIGSAVGLGNLWRFPFVAYEHGGGAFLIPFFVALVTTGIPLMILEYGLGVRLQGSAPKALAKISPRWEFVGWWALIVGMIICMYYVVIMGISADYFIDSFSSKMPWGDTANSAQTYLNKEILKVSEGPLQLDGLVPGILICSLVTWVMMFLIVVKGVDRVGKVVKYTVPTPYILLVILIIRGVTLKGSAEGLNYFFSPQWSALLDPSTWLAAYGQVFFSLSLGFGIMTAYASYLSRDSDINNNSFITCFADTATSYLAGFAIFSFLGYFAVATNSDIASVVKGGPTLAFVIYPAAISKLADIAGWMPPFFSVVFFLMLFVLGIDSAFSIVEAFSSGLEDKFKWSKLRIVTILSVIGAAGSVWFCTKAGIYWLDITDHFISDCYGLVLIGILEAFAVGWFWKVKKFREEINSVSEIRVGRWWDVCVKFVTPAVLIWLLVAMSIDKFKEPRIEVDYKCAVCNAEKHIVWRLKDDPEKKNLPKATVICENCSKEGQEVFMNKKEERKYNSYVVDYSWLPVILGGWLVVISAFVIAVILTALKPRNPNWLAEEGK